MNGADRDAGRLSFVASVLAAIRREGLPGLYKGLGLQLAKSVLAAALLFATREQILALVAKSLAAGAVRRAARAARTMTALS